MNAVSRRALMAMGVVLLAPAEGLAAPTSRRLVFAVFRNGARIGEHRMTIVGQADGVTASSDVSLVVKVGPVPVYRYTHRAVEQWRAGRFASLETSTNGGGKIQRVSARRTAAGVMIETGKGQVTAPAGAAPLTHWNVAVLDGPLFNPQDGKMLAITARRSGREAVKLADGRSIESTRWSLRGDTQIDNWYDEADTWAALRGKLPDGSMMEYRRL